MLGAIAGGACAVVHLSLDSAVVLQNAKTLADGTFADVQSGGDVIHGEGLNGAEEQAVNGTDRAGIPKKIGQIRENLDEAVGKLHGRGRLGSGLQRGGGECHIEKMARTELEFNLF